MANQPASASSIPRSREVPAEPGGTNRKSLERVSRDPDRSGDQGAAGEAQGEVDIRPGYSRSGRSQEEVSNPPRTGVLYTPREGGGGTEPSPPPAGAENPFQADGNILKTIASRFNEARDQQKAGAWKQLQKDLMNASPFICPGLIPYKDLIQIVADIEKEIKGSTAQVGRSNEEILADFLTGGAAIAAPVPVPPEGVLDMPVTLIEGDSV